MVPEIALTPQTVAYFRAHFRERVAVLHSRLSLGERYDQWWRIFEGELPVVIGARSAVFAPVKKLGLIILDEEHETSYKQEESPRYHARDVAWARAQREGAVLIMGSATPAVEVRWGGGSRRSAVALLAPESAPPSPPAGRDGGPAGGAPGRQPFDVQPHAVGKAGSGSGPGRAGGPLHEPAGNGVVPLVPGVRLRAPLHPVRGEPDAARPGDSPLPLLRRGAPAPGSLPAVRRALPAPFRRRHPADRAGSEEAVSQGAAREDGRRHHPRKGAHERIVEAFAAGRFNVLVGTQMVAKGLHFPGVTLVGVVSADTALNLPDFRVAERTFQLLSQVAGRAGRGERAGEVVIQTYAPDHYAIRAAVAHDYEGFYRAELAYRRRTGYPPFSTLVRLVWSGEGEEEVVRAAQAAGAAAAGDLRSLGVEALGPSPAPLSRLQGRYRWHLILKGEGEPAIEAARRIKGAHEATGSSGVRLTVDVDPVGML